jgi:ribosomal 50S subunit-recycling heat shock protein
MSTNVNTRGRRGRILVLLLVAVLSATTAAWAFWSQPGKGSASGHVASLSAPVISSAIGGGESATVSWSAVSAPASGAVKYYVSRDGEAAGGNCPTPSSSSTATSCTDAGVSPGSHSYTVTAVWRSWTATSAAKTATAISSPTVAAASPASRGQGAGAQTVTITGSHFASGASATFSGSGVAVNSTTFKSSTELTVAVTVATNASVGSRNVTVTNPDAGAGTGSAVFTVTAAPTVSSASPGSRGQGALGQTVAIKGSGFAGGASASFGAGVTVNSTTFKSSTELTANITIEAGASTGLRTVSVTNADGGTGSLANAFTITAAPTVTSTSPNSRGQGAVGQTVTIKGSGFTSGATSSFGSGIIVNSTTFKSSTELTANITIEAAASTGARTVTVTNADGGTGSANAFTVSAPPNVESTSPSSRPQGAAKQTVAIKGSGFVNGATSLFGSGITVESTTFVNSTELSAKISVESGASTGARTVTVTNPDGGVDTLAGGFTVTTGPSVESLTPSSGHKGGSQVVMIKGTGFASGATSSFGSGVIVNSTTFKSSTELTASIKIEAGASTGARSVTVTNTDFGSGSLAAAFTVNSAPSIESLTPSSRAQGAGEQTIVLKGANFESGAGLAVSLSGTGITVNSTSFVSASQVNASVNVTANAATGARTLTLTNPDATTATATFTVNAPPTVTSTSPNSRGQGASGQTITIKGSGFVSGATSAFGSGITVNSTTFKSSTELTADITIEAGASTGPRAVTVTNPDTGVGSLAGAFTVVAAPNAESVSPSSRGQGATGQTIAIKGSGFVSGTGLAVSFSGTGITVNSTTFKSSTELTANISVESGASTGARTVTVTNPDGGTDTIAGGFTVNAAPSITSPTSSFGSRVRITHNTPGEFKVLGSGFVSGMTVSISGGFTINSTTFVNSGELKVKVTAGNNGQRGVYDLTVTNPDGGSDTSENSIENT